VADPQDELPTVSANDANSGDYSATPPPRTISADDANSGEYSATPPPVSVADANSGAYSATPPEQTGILGAIPSGIAAGFKSLAGGAAELGGNRDQSAEAPETFTGTPAQITHGIFSSIPALIAGLGAGGLAVAAGAGTIASLPVLAAGGLTYGVISGIQSLYNEYQTNLQKNGGDKDEAFTDAAKVATIDAGGSAVSWAAFGAGAPATRALQPILKHIFVQAAAVQPGIGMATQAASNLARGDDVTEGVLAAGAQSAALTGILMAGHAGVSKVAGHIKARGEAADTAARAAQDTADTTARTDELAKLKAEPAQPGMEAQPDLPIVDTPRGGDTRIPGDLNPAEKYTRQGEADLQPPSPREPSAQEGLAGVEYASQDQPFIGGQSEHFAQPGVENPHIDQVSGNTADRAPPQGAKSTATTAPKDNATPAPDATSEVVTQGTDPTLDAVFGKWTPNPPDGGPPRTSQPVGVDPRTGQHAPVEPQTSRPIEFDPVTGKYYPPGETPPPLDPRVQPQDYKTEPLLPEETQLPLMDKLPEQRSGRSSPDELI
jgi:hypothetical protein